MMPNNYKEIFTAERGELFDIKVLNVVTSDWEQFLEYLTTHFKLSYEEGGVPKPLPAFDMIIERYAETPVTLKIHISSFTVNCFFFDLEEIDMDVSPTDIDSTSKATLIFGFMSDVARLLHKPVLMTPESSEYDPETLQKLALCYANPVTGEIVTKVEF